MRYKVFYSLTFFVVCAVACTSQLSTSVEDPNLPVTGTVASAPTPTPTPPPLHSTDACALSGDDGSYIALTTPDGSAFTQTSCSQTCDDFLGQSVNASWVHVNATCAFNGTSIKTYAAVNDCGMTGENGAGMEFSQYYAQVVYGQTFTQLTCIQSCDNYLAIPDNSMAKMNTTCNFNGTPVKSYTPI